MERGGACWNKGREREKPVASGVLSWLPGQHDANAPVLLVFPHHRGPKLLSKHVLLPEVFLLDILSYDEEFNTGDSYLERGQCCDCLAMSYRAIGAGVRKEFGRLWGRRLQNPRIL